MSTAQGAFVPTSTAPHDCDVVVIGAGHNGLVVANYLADAGLDVVVLERRSAIGGMTRSDFAIPQAPDHLINHCAVDPIFWTHSVPAAELALHKYGLRWVAVDPAFVYLHPDGASIAFWHDPQRTAGDIRRFSRADADAYIELATLFTAACDIVLPLFATNPMRPDLTALAGAARGVLRHRRRLADLAAFLVGSGRDIIADFEHPVVRSALHVASGCLYPSSHPGSTVQMLILAFVHRFNCFRPLGGIQRIPDALAARLHAVGGRVVTSALVRELLISSGCVTGAMLADGREVLARRAVLAACDPRQTLASLLPNGLLEPCLERRAAAIPANDLGWGQLKVDVACRGQVDLSRFARERADGADLRAASHLIGTEDGLERGYRRAAAGLLPTPPTSASTTRSRLQPTPPRRRRARTRSTSSISPPPPTRKAVGHPSYASRPSLIRSIAPRYSTVACLSWRSGAQASPTRRWPRRSEPSPRATWPGRSTTWAPCARPADSAVSARPSRVYTLAAPAAILALR